MEKTHFTWTIIKWFWATGARFLDGFEENLISGQRIIRIFGKRFMESEMTSVLVQGVGPEQKKLCFSNITILSTGIPIVNSKRFACFRIIQ